MGGRLGEEDEEGACSDFMEVFESERERERARDLGRKLGDPKTGDGGACADNTGERAAKLGDRM